MTARLPAMEEPRWGGPLLPGAIVLDAEELRQAADTLVPGEDPERGWIRYLRAMALLALRSWLKQRKSAVVVGPAIEPEAPDRLLAIGGLATQLLCASSLAEEVVVPLRVWEQTATAPQLALLALVDEENGVVEFPGVLEGSGMVAEIRKLRDRVQEPMELPVSLFQGSLERLLRWTTLLEPGALPRRGRRTETSAKTILEEYLKNWVETVFTRNSVVIPITATGGATRGISPIASNFIFSETNRITQGVRLLNPVIIRTGPSEYVARASCDRPTIWADTSLAEIQIWNGSELIWRQLATVDEPITGPIKWPLKDLSSMDKLTICLRPYGSRVGNQAVFKLVADERVQPQLDETTIRQHLDDAQDPCLFASKADASPGLVAELMARAALKLSFKGKLDN
jgi:hypothetical protein